MTKEYLHALDEVLPCMEWIKDNYPNCIKFRPNDKDLRSIAVYLAHNKPDTYISMNMMYGVMFTLAVLEYMIEIENYEKCKVIVEGIKLSNEIYKTELPTSLHSKWVSENINLSPLQILERHFKS